MQRVAQAIVLRAVHDFPRIAWRNRRQEIGINDAPLHHIDGGWVEVVLQPVLMKEMAVPVQAGGAQDMLSGNTLMLQVVQRITYPRVSQANVLINLIE